MSGGAFGYMARAAERAPARRNAGDPGYDGLRVIRGVVLACLLSVPAWVALGLLARAVLG